MFSTNDTKKERKRFSKEYREVLVELEELLPKDISAIATHNAGWRSGQFNPTKYLQDSEARYWRAYEILKGENIASILDVGGFLGAFPLVMQRMGFKVTVAEKFSYYQNSLDRIKYHLEVNEIRVIDIDFTESDPAIDSLHSTFGGVTCMAVAEHLAHSPKILMENMRVVLGSRGTLIFEVPNIAFWPNRYFLFFRGQTVMAPIQDVYYSETPFTGHHREYTLEDARYVICQAGFSIENEDTFNYSIDTNNLWQIVKFSPALLFKKWAEILIIHCRKADATKKGKLIKSVITPERA